MITFRRCTHSMRSWAVLLLVAVALTGTVNPFGAPPAVRAAGTDLTPYLVKDINPALDPLGSAPFGGITVGDIRYFIGRDDDHGKELWRTDGTEAGTWLVKDINPGPADGIVSSQVYDVNGNVIFRATDPDHGLELWQTDGTPDGTTLFYDFIPGPNSGCVAPIEKVGQKYLFFLCNQGEAVKWWTTDGTPAGTHEIGEALPGSAVQTIDNYAVLGNLIIYSSFVTGPGGASTPIELWRTDGTAAGTYRFYQVNCTPGTFKAVQAMVNFDQKLYLVMQTGAVGGELWSTDGTALNTHLYNLPSLPNGLLVVAPTSLAVAGSNLYFTASYLYNEPNQVSLLRIAAGANELVQVKVNSAPSGLPASIGQINGLANGKAVFLARDPNSSGSRLWITDGTVANTIEICPACKLSFPSYSFASWGGKLYFAGRSTDPAANHGGELWVTDGTATGTHELMDINPGLADSYPERFMKSGNMLYFTANDGVHGAELWAMQQPAGLTANYAAGAPGSMFTFSGEGFPQGSPVTVSIDGPSAQRVIGTVTPNADGAFTFRLNTFAAAPGVYTITATVSTGAPQESAGLQPDAVLSASFKIALDAAQPMRESTVAADELSVVPLSHVYMPTLGKH